MCSGGELVLVKIRIYSLSPLILKSFFSELQSWTKACETLLGKELFC